MGPHMPFVEPCDSPASDEADPGVRYPDGSVHYSDGSIDHPDGTIEVNGYLFDPIDWDELDPPEGSPGAVEIPHDVVVAQIAKEFGFKNW